MRQRLRTAVRALRRIADRRTVGWLKSRAESALQEEQHHEAIHLWLRAYEAGDAESAFHLAECYERGRGVRGSPADVINWHRRAAEGGHAEAQFRLGRALLHGGEAPVPEYWKHTTRDADTAARVAEALYAGGGRHAADPEQAIGWLEKAAESGVAQADALLGMIHLLGRHAPQNLEKGRFHFERGARRGDASAQFGLGDILYRGMVGGAPDHAAGADWYEKAADQGHRTAQLAMATIYRDGVGRDADPERFAHYMGLAAESGDAFAQFEFAVMLQRGQGVEADLSRAETFLRKSAKRDYRPAIIALADYYSQGGAVEPDWREAARWRLRAAELGDLNAMFLYARHAANGLGVPPNLEEAARWFLKAAEQGHETAAYNLAVCYQHGKGVGQDLKEALRWCEFAAEKGLRDAKVKLAELHLAGAGGTRDAPRAVELLKEASDAGDGHAKTQLAMIYLEGRDVFKDSRKAEQLLQDAAGSGYVAASLQLGHLYAGHYDPARAQPEDALGHYLVAAQAGNAIAQHLVANQLLSRNDPEAAKEGVRWLHRAADAGFPPAMFQMGVIFCQGQVVEKNLSEGVRWYERAAQQGHTVALYNLGVMVAKGLGVEADVEKGAEMMRRAEAEGALAKPAAADKPGPAEAPVKGRPALGVVSSLG
ncbi:hypothetical protein GJ654_12970 [Rhodoblastus acidophilus]|uniref:TPR repeat n=1 Tax=Rhodoblastus acidophilus TaxID=1074 RepID=A0A6N8DNK2_RHOAC|nr:tetratricopeptide repeat protein [Rhodoblastus acidophilus]MCW2275735.1 TPR repeat protein [Rhodoblastus acidophilus]MTV31898.1 hypothetical protein [Rhodoblastus acidophilus]